MCSHHKCNLCRFSSVYKSIYTYEHFSCCLFQRLRRLSTKYRTEKIYPTNVGEREENVKKNRYKDILPCKSKHTNICIFPHSSNILTYQTHRKVAAFHFDAQALFVNVIRPGGCSIHFYADDGVLYVRCSTLNQAPTGLAIYIWGQSSNLFQTSNPNKSIY